MSELAQTLESARSLVTAGRIDEARRLARSSLALRHACPEDLSRIAQTMISLGDPSAAEQAFRLATEKFPNDAGSRHNLGSYYAVNQRYDEAEAAYLAALSLDPDDADTHRNLAHLLYRHRRFSDAETHFRRANERQPADRETIYWWAVVFRRLAKFEDVAALLRPLLAADPADMRTRILLCETLIKLGAFDEHRRLIEDVLKAGTALSDAELRLFLDIFMNDRFDASSESEIFRAMAASLNRPPATAPRAIPGKSRLTIGYLTRYLDKLNYLGFLDALLEAHDRDRFEIVIYSEARRFGLEERVVSIDGLDNAALDRQIRDDGVDILVDLDGFSSLDRYGLFPLRPAPVIVSWFNAFSTLGLDSIDYLLCDDIVAPPEEDGFYTETLYRLPECYLLWHASARHPEVAPSPVLRNGYCTFGSLASDHKIGARSLDVWASILRRVPDSRFVLRNTNTDSYQDTYYSEAFAARGVDPDRISVLRPADHYTFLGTYNEIDIALDTFPWNGGTTTFEALWQGVPVVSWRGNRWAARAAATILSAVGRREWVGASLEEYEDIAVGLAQDSGRLAEIRRGQRERVASSILCDGERFTAKLEAAFADMYEKASA